MDINIVDELERRFLLQEEYLGIFKPINRMNPLVSVAIVAYQHVPYIGECLDSILMQKTDFPYEIIIGEDGSTDGTREICKEYAEKHQDKIRLFLRDRSISHCKQENTSLGFNGIFTRMSSRGKYTAICDGDDYWIDANKLKKQTSFLESNRHCSACFHNAFIVDESLVNFVSCFNIPANEDIFTTKCLFEHPWFIPTASIVYRTALLPTKYPEWYVRAYNRDLAILFMLSKEGSLGLVKGYLSVYRRNSINSLSLQLKERPDYYILKLVDLLNAVNLYFDGRYSNEAKRMCLKLNSQVAITRIKRFFRTLKHF
jgi:glycosyltransferase involved in cell wall biosynthesis